MYYATSERKSNARFQKVKSLQLVALLTICLSIILLLWAPEPSSWGPLWYASYQSTLWPRPTTHLLPLLSANSASAGSGIFTDLTGLTVVELKHKCKAAGLKVSGRKQELIDRLLGVSHTGQSLKSPESPTPPPSPKTGSFSYVRKRPIPTEADWQGAAGRALYAASDADSLPPDRADFLDDLILAADQTLRPFQIAGVDYALRTRRTFLADEMGLGKTVQALAALQAAGTYPAVIICPASLKINWQREAERWLPNATTQVLSGRSSILVKADITIINFEIVDANLYSLVNLRPKTLIVDESHRVKNWKAKVTIAVTKLATKMHGIPSEGKMKIDLSRPMDHLVLLLSGTPIPSKPVELVSQLEILGRMRQVFGSRQAFLDRYTDPKPAPWSDSGAMDYSGAANLGELNQKLRSHCFIRRIKKEVLKQMPSKEHRVLVVEGDATAMKAYAAQAKLVIDLLKAQKNKVRPKRRSRDSMDENEETAGNQEKKTSYDHRALAALNELRQLTAKTKTDIVNDWIDEFFASQDPEESRKLVVFAWHLAVVDSIAKAHKNKGAVVVTGEVSIAQRQKAVDAFQTDPNTRLIICNILAGGVGITLTAASDALFVELPWTPAALAQAVDRLHRIGQTADQVTSWYILTSGTIDIDMYHLLQKKQKILDMAMDGVIHDADASFVQTSIQQDLADMMA